MLTDFIIIIIIIKIEFKYIIEFSSKHQQIGIGR